MEAAFDALSIADSGWSVDSGGYVNYAFLLKNEKDGFRVLFPTVKITGRDASGKVLFSHEQVLPAINPGETVCYGFVAGNGTPPEDVEFVVARPDDYNISKHAAESPKFEVSAASAVPDGFGGANFTGEVAYLGGVLPSVSMGGVAVTVVLRDDAGENSLWGNHPYGLSCGRRINDFRDSWWQAASVRLYRGVRSSVVEKRRATYVARRFFMDRLLCFPWPSLSFYQVPPNVHGSFLSRFSWQLRK